METTTKQLVEIDNQDFDFNFNKVKVELDDYLVKKFVSVLKSEKRQNAILVNELNSITEGKKIILSNAK